MNLRLELLQIENREQFIKNNQEAFQKAFTEEFGASDKMVLPRQDVEKSLDNQNAVAYRILLDDAWVGGVVLSINKKTQHNTLDLFFINPGTHGKGIGLNTWKLIEKMHSETKVWETMTPYFEKRNIHFYVNKCGFKIVEFFNPYHKDPNMPNSMSEGEDYFFRFEKVMG